MINFLRLKKALMFARLSASSGLVLLWLSACHGNNGSHGIGGDIEKPQLPQGLGFSLVVKEPNSVYPLPVVDNIGGNSGVGPDGNEVNKYDLTFNPIIKILSGLNDIWTLGDDEWAQGGANGSGPTDFSRAVIVDEKVWRDNISYVIDVTNNRTYKQALEAYLDDRRDKNFSVIDGLGPLTEDYISGSEARAAVIHNIFDANLEESHPNYFNVYNTISFAEGGDNSGAKGSLTSPLGQVVSLVKLLRDSSASTSPSKYYYSSPRPWRMNDDGDVVEDTTQVEFIGDKSFQIYESNVSVVPALKYVRRKAEDGRRKDGGYPSGHTNAGYLAAYAYAYAIPERFGEMLTRASQLGEDRILAGMHSPVDVMGARIQSSAVAAAALYNIENEQLKTAAYDQAGQYFKSLAGGMSLYEYAHQEVSDDRWSDHDMIKSLYRQRLTYGFTQNAEAAGQEAIVPKGAEVLLETRLPYLTPAQRRAVLYTTSLDSGYPLLDDSNGWGRLDYVSAADGYGAFIGDVTVSMDAEKGRFHKKDIWCNDIGGTGRLTKEGTGTLELTGNNSYSGGTVVLGGTLKASSTKAFGNGDLYLSHGKVDIDVKEPLNLSDNFTIDGGALSVKMNNNRTQVSVEDTIYIESGVLNLDLTSIAPRSGSEWIIMEGQHLVGAFTKVNADNRKILVKYTESKLIVIFK